MQPKLSDMWMPHVRCEGLIETNELHEIIFHEYVYSNIKHAI